MVDPIISNTGEKSWNAIAHLQNVVKDAEAAFALPCRKEH